MSLVKFASLCDVCAKRSEEYTEWATCLDCGRHLCGECGPEQHLMGGDAYAREWLPKEDHA